MAESHSTDGSKLLAPLIAILPEGLKAFLKTSRNRIREWFRVKQVWEGRGPGVWLYLLRFYHKLYLTDSVPIVVYQMGKVGSSSVWLSLQEQLGRDRVVHTHYMSDENLDYWEAKMATTKPLAWPMLRYHQFGRVIRRHVVDRNQRAKFITLVRDPIAVNIGFFFQMYQLHTGYKFLQSPLSLDELIEVYLNSDQTRPINWFDTEIKRVLGIDVYAFPFPKDKGYQHLYRGNFDLLIIKTETDDAVKTEAIKAFLNMPEFTLERHNVTEERYDGEVYKAFKQRIELPESLVNEMYDSRYMRHFYSVAEIAKFRAKWLPNQTQVEDRRVDRAQPN
jgi:hypothetical protein